MSVIEQLSGVRPRGVPVRGDHHTLSGRQSVVLDHPGGLSGGGTESVKGGVQKGGSVDGLAGGGPHTAAPITSLAKALEPSIRAASLDGPKQAMPAS